MEASQCRPRPVGRSSNGRASTARRMLPCYIPRLLFVEEEPFPMDLNLEAAFDQPVDLSHQFDFPARSLERPELVSLSPVTCATSSARSPEPSGLDGRNPALDAEATRSRRLENQEVPAVAGREGRGGAEARPRPGGKGGVG